MSVWVARYQEHAAVRRSVNGRVMRVCFSVTSGSFYARESRLKVVLHF